MQMQILGAHPLEPGNQAKPRPVIGTLFPDHQTLFTLPPQLHAWQRHAFVQYLISERALKGLPPLTPADEEKIYVNSVDLVFEPGLIYIRPHPQRMDLAFAADELLQQIASKRQIKFLNVSDARVREAIRRRGECWRLSSLPKTVREKHKLVFGSKVSIQGLPIYFYNRLTGTRWLTFQSFAELGNLPSDALARHLQEIAEHAARVNRLGWPEIDFFAVDLGKFGAKDFEGEPFTQIPEPALRSRFAALLDRFRACVHEGFRIDSCENGAWSKRMIPTLFLDGNEAQTEQILTGLSPEFFLQVEWLPGGRFEEGEFLFDSLYDEAMSHPEDAALGQLCDPRAKGIIFNLIREFGDLEYINVGCIPESLSRKRPEQRTRRGVFIAELKSRSEAKPIRRFVRQQRWGVWEHLDEGKDMLQSIQESEEYSDYWLDRRLGCRQLGMNLTRRVIMRRLIEVYTGAQRQYHGQLIRTSYFEREYVSGTATDKLPPENYSRAGYARRLAELLGKAAVPSMIVGRSLDMGTQPVFDDGDEVVVEGEDGLPAQLLLGDHSGAFGEYEKPLAHFAAHYARPVNERLRFLPNPAEFALVYLGSFRAQFLHVQNDYRKRRRAFDTLFKHCHYDKNGSFAYRWENVLRRLETSDVDLIVSEIRKHIQVPGFNDPVTAAEKPPSASLPVPA